MMFVNDDRNFYGLACRSRQRALSARSASTTDQSGRSPIRTLSDSACPPRDSREMSQSAFSSSRSIIDYRECLSDS